MKITHILKSARLRTLPLSLAGVFFVSKIAFIDNYFSINIFILYLLTAVLLQILSNFANDYGDGIKGTDSLRSASAPKRMVESGKITVPQMKILITITAIFCFISGTTLSYISFPENFILIFSFSLLGIVAIFSAIKYTVGKKAYGYYGLGDLFVFIFFGLVSILGGYYLYSKILDLNNLLPAVSIGTFSVGVLNLNNLRDYENDKKANKNTLIVKIGYKKGIVYHFFLILTGFTCLFFYNKFLLEKYYSLTIVSILILFHLIKVARGININNELKYLSLITLLCGLI